MPFFFANNRKQTVATILFAFGLTTSAWGAAAKPAAADAKKPGDGQTQPQIKIVDPLFKSQELDLSEVYPKKNVVLTPSYLFDVKKPTDISAKPILRVGLPIVPVLDYYDNLGMDLFSGDISLALALQMKNPIIGGSLLEIELGLDSLTSAENAGLSDITQGKINGTTSHTAYNGLLNLVFYPSEIFYFSIGLGASLAVLDYEFAQTEFLVNGEVKTIESDSSSSVAPMSKLTLGVDFPVYRQVRAQIFTDFKTWLFSDTVGGQVGLGAAISYSL